MIGFAPREAQNKIYFIWKRNRFRPIAEKFLSPNEIRFVWGRNLASWHRNQYSVPRAGILVPHGSSIPPEIRCAYIKKVANPIERTHNLLLPTCEHPKEVLPFYVIRGKKVSYAGKMQGQQTLISFPQSINRIYWVQVRSAEPRG